MFYTPKKSELKIIILLLLIAVTLNACAAQKYSNKLQPTAKDGVLDLHDWDFERDGPVELNGDWEFYWKKLISPEVFKKNQAITERELIYVPGNWNNHKYKNQSHNGFGYATYRLKVLLGKNYNDLSFKIMTISTSYIFFVNGVRITSVGVVGTTAETARPEYRLSKADYVNEAKELDIVLYVSNFTHFQG